MDHNVNHPERSTRNSERTKGAILEAAAAALIERGSGVSLDFIAKRAGVSKSGLQHHFPNKEELFVALVSDVQQQLRVNVQQYVDLSENQPGKLLRAYVRALTSGSAAMVRYFTAGPIWAGISQFPRVVEISRADATWWNNNLAADGLAADRIMLVRRAAEGLAAAVAYGDESSDSVQQARTLLIHLASGGQLNS